MRDRVSGRIDQPQVANTGTSETNPTFGNVGSRPAERIEYNDGNTFTTGVYRASKLVPAAGDHLFGQPPGKIVTARRILINVIGHDPGGQVVSLIEEDRLPGSPKH